jgi:lipoate---protein ligase
MRLLQRLLPRLETMTNWRVIGLSENNAFRNMAIDEAISNAVSKNESKPTIRFYKWKPGAVSIGYFQNLNDEVDIELCKNMGIDFVRRRTGGGAVFHEAEITYSVIAPESLFPRGITESYREICGWIINALAKLGIAAEFKPINDIITNGRKISGNAQTRRNKVLLQHGTILYGLNLEKMFSLLKVPKEKISDKMIQSAKERVTSISDINPAITEKQLVDALMESFTNGKDFGISGLSQKEEAEAEKLAKEKYSAEEWNLLRSP